MGLLAIVASQARRIGLLPRVIRALPAVSVLCVLVGLLLLASLPLEGQFRSTYLSENALLPHQAITFFRESDWDVVRGVKHEVRDIKDLETRDERVSELFESFGLAAYTDTNSSTVYAISRASRGPHNEAVVIAAPWFAEDMYFNEGGVALTLSLARTFQRWSFWHKNLIFVLPNSTTDLRSWVDAYHTSLQHTAGSIEGAIVMEYTSESEHFSAVDVCFEGLNGQLPNLDLVNTAIHSTRAEFAPPQVLGGENSDFNGGDYMGRLKTMVRHIGQQAAAGLTPSTASAMFSGWRIDAVTLRAIIGEQPRYDITTFGRVAESTARSINNLLEHFHQSFFFYLMMGTNHFVSIASFLPAGLAIAGSFSVMALYLLASLKSVNVVASAQAGVSLAIIIISACVMGYGWAYGYNAAAVGAAALLIGIATFSARRLSPTALSVLYAAALIIAGLQLSALAMINFSLALVLGVLMSPLAWIRPGSSSLRNRLLVTVACPAAVLAALAKYYFDLPLLALVHRISSGFSELSVWTWMVIWGIWVPLWVVSVISA